jgi:predicted phage terminase large subunit-like protein
MKLTSDYKPTQRNKANDWYDHTFYNRLNSKADGAIVIVMQRLHMDDLVGHVLERDQWEVVALPAIAVEDEIHHIETPYGAYTHIRRAGEALHPERESLESLAQTRATVGEDNFAGQHQQNPVPQGGGMVKRAWFNVYEQHQLPGRFDQIVQSWDSASKESELASFSVCTTWGVQEKKLYLLHVFRKRMDYPNLKRAVDEQYRLFKPDVILIEDKSSGIQLIQELLSEGVHVVKGVKPEGNKVMRLHAQTATIENGFVYLPREAPWLMEYIIEMTSFPKAKHSDQVDSTSQALAWIKSGLWGPGMGLYNFYKGEAARKVGGKGI